MHLKIPFLVFNSVRHWTQLGQHSVWAFPTRHQKSLRRCVEEYTDFVTNSELHSFVSSVIIFLDFVLIDLFCVFKILIDEFHFLGKCQLERAAAHVVNTCILIIFPPLKIKC